MGEKNTKKKEFLGRELINNNDAEETIKIKKQWNSFVNTFWLIFLLKLLSKGNSFDNEHFALILFVSQFLAIICMVVLMGYYSYKFSGRKIYCLFGLFGFFWFLILGIFIGFFQVKNLKDKRIKSVNKNN